MRRPLYARPRQNSSKAPLQSERGTDSALLVCGSWTKQAVMTKRKAIRRSTQCGFLCLAIFILIGSGDEAARFDHLGHQLMCICSCRQILLECNHVGCPDSDGMRNELMAAVSRGDSDSLLEQAFVQKYRPTVLAAPTTKGFDRAAYIVPPVGLILGFGLIVLVIRSWKNRPA